jgi:hypothetical protein
MKSLVLAVSLLAQATDPPPLPEAPPPPPAPLPEPAPGAPTGNPAIDKYQHCFQKMIDAGKADNAYMRKCLGLEPKGSKKLPPGERATLTREEVGEVAAKGLPALRECYEKHLTKTKALGMTPEGVVEPTFDVRPDGAVEGLGYASASVNDLNLLTCLRDQIAAWRFPKTAGSDKLSVRLAFQLAVDERRKGRVSIVKGHPKLAGPGLGYAAEELLAVFRKNAAGVRQCYDKLLARKPLASGVAAVDVTVGPRGRVSKVAYRQLTVDDPTFKACLSGAIKKWKFPRPRSGDDVVAKYPPWSFVPAVAQPPPPPQSFPPQTPPPPP